MAERFPERAHDMTFLRHRTLSEMFAAAGQSEKLHADAAFEVFFAARAIESRSIREVEAALERLSRRYRLFALSNGNADLRALRNRALVRRSCQRHLGRCAPKPDIRIFSRI